jgi:hypothetical protein
MEFETTDSYGLTKQRVKCNLGCVYSSKIGQPFLVSSQTAPEGAAVEYGKLFPKSVESGEICRATHTKSQKDAETGYEGPLGLKFEWEGKENGKGGQVKASVEVETSLDDGKGGLIEKVSLLGRLEISE